MGHIFCCFKTLKYLLTIIFNSNKRATNTFLATFRENGECSVSWFITDVSCEPLVLNTFWSLCSDREICYVYSFGHLLILFSFKIMT